MSGNQPKIVSLVPSWTETLVSANVHVVGRTRFCVHPAQLVDSIPVVGGTKSLDLRKIKSLSPDFVLVDKQENTREMADLLLGAGFKLIITDVTDIHSVVNGLREISNFVGSDGLNKMADRYQNILQNKLGIDSRIFFNRAILKGYWSPPKDCSFAYVIWKKPFMVVGDSTFIGSVFAFIGIHFNVKEKYPEISDADLKTKYCLFSSEPFPFEKNYEELIREGYHGVVVDGEKLSWFGIRNLLFLEACLK